MGALIPLLNKSNVTVKVEQQYQSCVLAVLSNANFAVHGDYIKAARRHPFCCCSHILALWLQSRLSMNRLHIRQYGSSLGYGPRRSPSTKTGVAVVVLEAPCS